MSHALRRPALLVLSLVMLASSLAAFSASPAPVTAMSASCVDGYGDYVEAPVYLGNGYVQGYGQINCQNSGPFTRTIQVCDVDATWGAWTCRSYSQYASFFALSVNRHVCSIGQPHVWQSWIWFQDYDGSTRSWYSGTRTMYFYGC